MSMVCIYALGGNLGVTQHCCLLCVMHNSVGSALLVPTVGGHTRASMRGTSDSTVPALFYWLMLLGAGGNVLRDVAMNEHKFTETYIIRWVKWSKISLWAGFARECCRSWRHF